MFYSENAEKAQLAVENFRENTPQGNLKSIWLGISAKNMKNPLDKITNGLIFSDWLLRQPRVPVSVGHQGARLHKRRCFQVRQTEAERKDGKRQENRGTQRDDRRRVRRCQLRIWTFPRKFAVFRGFCFVQRLQNFLSAGRICLLILRVFLEILLLSS